MNKKLGSIIIGSLSIIFVLFFVISSSEINDTATIEENLNSVPIEEKSEIISSPKIIETNVYSLFKTFSYEDDFEIIDGQKIWRNSFYQLDESNLEIYANMEQKEPELNEYGIQDYYIQSLKIVLLMLKKFYPDFHLLSLI